MDKFPLMLYGDTVEVYMIVNDQDEQDEAESAGWKTHEALLTGEHKKRTRRTKEQIEADEKGE